jgi:molybdopterin molybdotransferase
MTDLLPIREAQLKILATVKPASPEFINAEKAFERVLASDILSPLNLPPFTNSSMDGFAVHSGDVTGATQAFPVQMPVTLDIPAGSANAAALPPGAAARILTGAPLPPGADTVVPVENTDQFRLGQSAELTASVAIFAAVKPGENVRPAGEDVRQGQLVLRKGRILQPQDVGLLISLGIRQVAVTRKARIALFSSGDELLEPGQALAPGKIYDSNRFVLTGLLQAAGAEVIQLGITHDTREIVLATLDRALQDPPDMIISSAGVSVGVFDYVQQVLKENGTLSFWRVNMRPGKPVAYGSYKGIPFMGLPGNPVSAYIGCLMFVIPFIRQIHGLPPFDQKVVKAVLTEPLESADGRESFYRGFIRRENGINRASLTGHQGSGNLFSLVQANALLVVPAGVKRIDAGETVSAWALDKSLED